MALASLETQPISAIEFDILDLDDSDTWRERDSIDILVLNERHKLGIVMENKVESQERPGQLERYREHMKQQFPSYRFLFIYLTVAGDDPSDKEYAKLTYSDICGVVEQLLHARASILGPDVTVLLRHYASLLRRHFMEESELIRLARQIYQKPRGALDFIFEQRPDQLQVIADFLKELANGRRDLVLDYCTKSHVRFALNAWESRPELKGGSGWTPTGRLLLFEFWNSERGTRLKLVIGPGDSHVRQRLFDTATRERAFFKNASTLYPKWTLIWSRPILDQKDLETKEQTELEEKLSKAWDGFLATDLPKITAMVEKALA